MFLLLQGWDDMRWTIQMLLMEHYWRQCATYRALLKELSENLRKKTQKGRIFQVCFKNPFWCFLIICLCVSSWGQKRISRPMVGGQWARYSFCSRTGLDASNGRRVGAPYSHLHRRDSTKSGFVWKFVDLLLNIVIIWCADPGHSDAVDQYIKNLPRRSNALPESAKKMSDGLAGLHTVSAKDLPGILMQVVSFLCVFLIIFDDFGRCLSQLDLTAATNFQSRSQRKSKRQFIFSLFCTAQDMNLRTVKGDFRKKGDLTNIWDTAIWSFLSEKRKYFWDKSSCVRIIVG